MTFILISFYNIILKKRTAGLIYLNILVVQTLTKTVVK